MKPGSKGGGRIAEEAAFWVVTLSEKPNRRTRARFRAWALRSTKHWAEFLIAASIYRAFQGFDAQRTVNVRELMGDAATTVVPLRTPSGHSPEVPGGAALFDDALPDLTPKRRAILADGRSRRVHWKLAYHAAAVLLLSIALPLVGQCLQLPTRQEYSTGVGQLQTIALEDGSIIHLNQQSDLAITRTPHAHTVQLRRGEALFTVAHHPEHRLWVLLGGAAVEDVGTQFNVRRSANDSTVSVIEGSVRVGSDPPAASARAFLVADAGQEVQIHGAQLQLQRRTLSELESQAAWAKGWLTFNGEPINEVARALNQHNRRQLIIADPSIAQLPVGGRFLAGDFDAVIKALTSALPVRVLPSRGAADTNIVRLGRVVKPPLSAPAFARSVPNRPHT